MTKDEAARIEIIRESTITILKGGRRITLNNRELMAILEKLVRSGDITILFNVPCCMSVFHEAHDEDADEIDEVPVAGICFKPGHLLPWDDDQQDSESGITMVCDQNAGLGEVVSFCSPKEDYDDDE